MTKIRGFEVITEYQNKDIKLPERSTTNSAGYDFFAPEDITIEPCKWTEYKSIVTPNQLYKDETSNNIIIEYMTNTKPILVPTGIKAYMLPDEFLGLYNRSSNPKKLGLIVASGVNIIDSDYYNNIDNEGHIFFMFWNFSDKTVYIKKGDKIGQGIFQKYLLDDRDRKDTMSRYEYEELQFGVPDNTLIHPTRTVTRTGGFGSTGK